MRNNNDKARIRVFFGEIEGDNATLKDALRSIGEAVKQTFQPELKTVRVIATGGNLDQKQLTAASQVIEQEMLEEYEDELTESNSNGAAAKSRASRPKKAITYSLIKDLNLQPPDKKHLRDFFNEKKPGNQKQQITVIVYYLHRILEIQSIGVNHVFTGIKHLSLRIPPDIAQVMRSVASEKGYLDTSNTEDVKMAIAGENFVEHDLPAKGATTAD